MKQPTYIDLLNQFWNVCDRTNLTATEGWIYFHLLREANRLQWTNPFPYPTRNLSLRSGLSESTIVRARNRLKQAGLIDFDTGNRRTAAPRFYLHYESKTDGKRDGKTDGIYKDIKTKDNNNPFVFPLEGDAHPERNAECRMQKAESRPTQEQVEAYIEEYSQRSGRQPEFTAERWMAYYQSNGWRVGRNPMKDWRAAVRTWFTQQNKYTNNGTTQTTGAAGYGTNHPAGKYHPADTNQPYNPKTTKPYNPSAAEQARLERERDAASIIARLAAQNRLD